MICERIRRSIQNSSSFQSERMAGGFRQSDLRWRRSRGLHALPSVRILRGEHPFLVSPDGCLEGQGEQSTTPMTLELIPRQTGEQHWDAILNGDGPQISILIEIIEDFNNTHVLQQTTMWATIQRWRLNESDMRHTKAENCDATTVILPLLPQVTRIVTTISKRAQQTSCSRDAARWEP